MYLIGVYHTPNLPYRNKNMLKREAYFLQNYLYS